jgi:hypothetical protein
MARRRLRNADSVPSTRGAHMLQLAKRSAAVRRPDRASPSPRARHGPLRCIAQGPMLVVGRCPAAAQSRRPKPALTLASGRNR